MSAPAALATAEPEHAMPKPAAKIAEKVLARVHGRPSRQADEYLETLAEWQVGRADASLKRLLQALAADASATRAESGTAAGKYAPHAKDKAALHGKHGPSRWHERYRRKRGAGG